MERRHRVSAVSFIVLLLLSAGAALFCSCDEDPANLCDWLPPDTLSGTGTIYPEQQGEYLFSSVTSSRVAPGTIEIWVDDVAFDAETGIVSFNATLVNWSSVSLLPPVRFVITSIDPQEIAVVDFEGISSDDFPYYSFSEALGEDRFLSPGERTLPITMEFHTITERSFVIDFRIDIGPLGEKGIIAGIVFRDDNRNGELDRCDTGFEPGIPNITVALERPLANGDAVMIFSRTDSLGQYHFEGLEEGTYKVLVSAPEDIWEVTSDNPLFVTLERDEFGAPVCLGAHFGLFPILPPLPDVLFGPVLVGPASLLGIELDSTFVAQPSLLPVEFSYYLDITPPFEWPLPLAIDTAAAWINGELVFEYRRAPWDSVGFLPVDVELREDLVKDGDNTIRLFTDGDETAALLWRLYRMP